MVLDLRQAYREGRQRWARNSKQVMIDPAGGILHDTATESPWQAEITKKNSKSVSTRLC